MTCYDVYFNEQIEYLASQKPDIILIPGYQRGETTDIIRAQTKLIAFRCNSFVAKSEILCRNKNVSTNHNHYNDYRMSRN